MNKLEDAVLQELMRLEAENDQAAVDNVLSVVGQEYASKVILMRPQMRPQKSIRDNLYLDDPEFENPIF